MLTDTAAPQAPNALAVRGIDHDQGLVLHGYRANLGQGRALAVHAEHPIGHDEPLPDTPRAGEGGGQVVWITVPIADHLGARQAAAINDAGLVQRV